jgi:hypothetical protein
MIALVARPSAQACATGVRTLLAAKQEIAAELAEPTTPKKKTKIED